MTVESFKDYANKQREMGQNPTPESWWNEWLSEHERSFIISRLQMCDARYIREYGLAKTWRAIPERQQGILVNV